MATKTFRSHAEMWTHLLAGGKVESKHIPGVWWLENGNFYPPWGSTQYMLWYPYGEPQSGEEKFKAYYDSWWGGAIRRNR